MPNIKRRFKDDDPSSEEEGEDEEPDFQPAGGGGKGLRMPGGGKGFGKQFRPSTVQQDDDSEDSDEEEEDEPQQPAYRQGGGKQLRPPPGKSLRPPQQDDNSDDEDDDDDEEDDDEELDEDEPVRPVHRGGGKSLMRMSAPDDDDGSDEEEEAQPPQRVAPSRGGGKSLMRMQAQHNEESEEEESSEDEEPARVAPARGGGKQLRPPEEKQMVGRGGGKQLRPSPAEEEEDDDDDDDSDEEEETTQPVQVVRRGGGKSLMRMPPTNDDSDDDDSDEEEEEEPPKRVAPAAGGGKQLRPAGGKQLRPPGGKQLRRPVPEDDEDEDDDDEEEDTTNVVDEDTSNAIEAPAAPDVIDPPAAAPDVVDAPAAPDKKDTSDDDMEVDDSEEGEEEEVKTKPAPKAKAAPKRKPGRPKKAAPAPEAVEESDDDEVSSDEEAEFDMETFDPQKLVNDEEDQKYLDSLPEFEREAILGERFEKRKADMDMKKALRDAKRKEREDKAGNEPKGRKRKAATKATATKKATAAKKKKTDEDDDDVDADAALAKTLASKRGSTRNRDVTGARAKKAEALAALRHERKKVTKKGSSDSDSSFGDDDDDDSDDDYEDSGALKPWQKKAAETRKSRLDQVEESDEEMEQADDDNYKKTTEDTQRVVQEAELEDYLKITVSRRKLGRWCNEPYFKKAVVGCFAKLFIGENEQGKRCYRLCRIVDVEPAPKGSYSLPAVKKEMAITTDKALKLQFGKNERTFLMKLVSDNKASENDVFLYKTEVKNQRQQVLSMKEANKIRRKQDELVGNYTYTTEDIETNLRNRKKKNQSAANLGSEQTRAAIAVQAGKAALVDAKLLAKSGDGDSAGVDAAKKALQERLEDERLVMERVKDRNDRLTLRGADKKWALVNKRALEMNQKLDRGALRDLAQEKKDSESKPKFNPYARRKVKPKILWEVGQKDDEEKAELKKAEAKKAAESREKEHDGTPSLVQEQQEKAAAQNQSHQFAIDEEIMAQSSFTNGITGLSAKKPVRKRVRKGLSLNDYLERKGAGTL